MHSFKHLAGSSSVPSWLRLCSLRSLSLVLGAWTEVDHTCVTLCWCDAICIPRMRVIQAVFTVHDWGGSALVRQGSSACTMRALPQGSISLICQADSCFDLECFGAVQGCGAALDARAVTAVSCHVCALVLFLFPCAYTAQASKFSRASTSHLPGKQPHVSTSKSNALASRKKVRTFGVGCSIP